MPRPGGDALARLAAAIPHAAWFAALGDPLADGERQDAEAWLSSLELGGLGVAGVADWSAAKRIVGDPAWDRRWWDAEERLRAGLLQQAEARHGHARVMERLSGVALAAHDATLGAAARAAAAAGVADPALSAAAAGAATQACYQAGLALLAHAGPNHAFAAKLRLFQGGRWPLGILDGTAYIF